MLGELLPSLRDIKARREASDSIEYLWRKVLGAEKQIPSNVRVVNRRGKVLTVAVSTPAEGHLLWLKRHEILRQLNALISPPKQRFKELRILLKY